MKRTSGNYIFYSRIVEIAFTHYIHSDHVFTMYQIKHIVENSTSTGTTIQAHLNCQLWKVGAQNNMMIFGTVDFCNVNLTQIQISELCVEHIIIKDKSYIWFGFA